MQPVKNIPTLQVCHYFNVSFFLKLTTQTLGRSGGLSINRNQFFNQFFFRQKTEKSEKNQKNVCNLVTLKFSKVNTMAVTLLTDNNKTIYQLNELSCSLQEISKYELIKVPVWLNCGNYSAVDEFCQIPVIQYNIMMKSDILKMM